MIVMPMPVGVVMAVMTVMSASMVVSVIMGMSVRATECVREPIASPSALIWAADCAEKGASQVARVGV